MNMILTVLQMLRMTETSLGWRVSDDESRMSLMMSLRWRVSDGIR